MDLIKHEELKCQPGAKFNYSNSNFVLLAYILEKVAGVSYAACLQKYIFEALGMQNSYVDDGSNKPHQAIGYTLELDQFSPTEPYEMSWSVGAGNVCSTVGDLYLFDEALHTGKLLNAELVNLMRTGVMQTGGMEYARIHHMVMAWCLLLLHTVET